MARRVAATDGGNKKRRPREAAVEWIAARVDQKSYCTMKRTERGAW